MMARLTLYPLKSKMKALAVTAEAPEMLRIPLAWWHLPALASWPCKAAKALDSRRFTGNFFHEIPEPLKTFPEGIGIP